MQQSQNAVDAQNASNVSAQQGPPSELPEAVPDFVSDILGSIPDVVGGGADGLGSVVSDVATNAEVAEVAGALPDVVGAIPF